MPNNVPLHQGKDAVGRPSSLLSRSETHWRQTLLVPPEQVTVRLDLGWDARDSVGMFAAEASVSGTRELLALEVHPVAFYPTLSNWIGSALTWQRSVLLDLFDPDPF